MEVLKYNSNKDWKVKACLKIKRDDYLKAKEYNDSYLIEQGIINWLDSHCKFSKRVASAFLNRNLFKDPEISLCINQDRILRLYNFSDDCQIFLLELVGPISTIEIIR